MNFQTILIIALLLAIAYMIVDRQKASGRVGKDTTDYSKAYQAKYLLTRNEWHEYKKLKEFVIGKGLVICPKVRVLDIIEPRKDQDNYRALLNKVQSKHVDFLITDEELHIKGIIELDDNSHNKADRKERDEFVNTILESVGYKVIHTRSVTADTLNALIEQKHKST